MDRPDVLRLVDHDVGVAARECRELGDSATGAIFEEMTRDEEGHADYFESQLDAIARVGLQGYLAQQIDAGSGPA